jgi:tetratricopeptide (TPR) repeat protein
VAQPKAAHRFQAEPQADEIAIEAGPVNVTREKRIEDAIDRKMAEAKASQPAPRPTEPVKVVEPAPEAKHDAAADSHRSASAAPARATAAREEPAPRVAPPAKRALLAAYEKGDADASLQAAKDAGDKALVTQLQKFIAAYGAGEAAFDRNDAKAAIARYEEALTLDQKLSDGFGKYGKEIRTRLSTIWLAAGNQYAKSGQSDPARTALKESLKYDPSNSKAKTLLASLDKDARGDGSDEEERPAVKKSTRHAAAADESAGEDEEERPKKTAKKTAEKPAEKEPARAAPKKSSRAAIDDAFGD